MVPPPNIPDPHYKDWPLGPEDLVGQLCVDKMAAACLKGQGCESACKICLDDLPKGPEMSKAQCTSSFFTPSYCTCRFLNKTTRLYTYLELGLVAMDETVFKNKPVWSESDMGGWINNMP
ncbi:hypothetical protein RJ55_02633 [Drechmeria coniospora]|nr:hypothetical protein RJ55_02633 [Drechmeria coniospora]